MTVSLRVFFVNAPVVESTPNNAMFLKPFIVVSCASTTCSLMMISSSFRSSLPLFVPDITLYRTNTAMIRMMISTIKIMILLRCFLACAFLLLFLPEDFLPDPLRADEEVLPEDFLLLLFLPLLLPEPDPEDFFFFGATRSSSYS